MGRGARRQPPAPGALLHLLIGALAAGAIAAPAASAAGTRVSSDGAWTYFTEPRAVNHDGEHRRTYVGWIDSRGQIVVASYDHRSRVRTRAVLQTGERVDDHNNPSLIVRPDGRVLVFYSTERRRNLVYRVSRRPESVRAWRRPHRVPTNVRGRHGYTYPNPVWLAEEERPLFLFWRGGSFEPTYSTSADGTSWRRARRLVDGNGQRPYLVFDSNGHDRIDIAFSDGNPSELQTRIYYMRYRSRRLRRAGGSLITRMRDLPVQPSQADVVYAGRGGAPRAWAYDVGVGRDGRPVVLYATFPSASDHRYNYARWNGSRWVSHEITRAGPTIEKAKGDANYAGGLVLDSRDPSVVYLSRQVGGVYQVERWRTQDGGLTWHATPVTTGSRDNYRPVSVQGPSFGRSYDLFWMRGRYTGWLDFGTSIETRLRGRAGAPPNSAFRLSRHRDPRTFTFTAAVGGRHVWRFGDGSTAVARGREITHTYRRKGRYRVVATALSGERRDVYVRELRVRR
jgi:hypothetical protein